MLKFKPWQKVYGLIWVGQAFSTLSSSIVQFAVILYLTDKTGSGAILSLAALVGFLPQGLLGPFAGVFVDRWDRKKVMIISDGAIALASLAIVIAAWEGNLPLWLVISVLAVRSIGGAFHAPSLSAVTPQLVPEEDLTRCAGLSQAVQSVSLIIGPALAAICYANWDLSAIIFLDVIGAAIAIVTLLFVKIPKLVREHPLEKPRVFHEMKEGFQALRSHPGLLGLVLISALYFVAIAPVSALSPLIAMDYFQAGTQGASIAEVVFSVGMLVGSLVLGAWGGFRNKITTISWSIFLMGMTLAACFFLPGNSIGFTIYAVLCAAMGFSAPFYSGTAMSLLQSKVEPQYMGRVASLSVSIMTLASPIGLGLSGISTDFIGVNNWFGICGIITLACGVLCLAVPTVRTCAMLPHSKK